MHRCLLFLLLLPLFAPAQHDRMWAARAAAERLDSGAAPQRSVQLLLDSIEVTALVYPQHITAACVFRSSGSRVQVSFYERDGWLHLAAMKESSPVFTDLYRYTGYLYAGDSIVDRDYHRTRRICMAIDLKAPRDPDGYNGALDEAFCERFFLLLYRRLRPARS